MSTRPGRVESSRGLNLTRLERSTMSQDARSNASELVGERDGEDVVMQPLLGRFEPRLEAVALPALGLDQHNPCRLHEQDTQVAIAALGYLAEDGAVAGRVSPSYAYTNRMWQARHTLGQCG